jgi:hypothetical protein
MRRWVHPFFFVAVCQSMTDIHRTPNQVSPPASAYFVNTARNVFDDYFAARGALPMPSSSHEVVRYETAAWFAEVIYLPYDGPRYSPRLQIGVIPEPFDDPRRNRIDVLHTTSIDSDLRRYNLTWRYTNSQEARQAFMRVRDEILTPYTDAFLNDVSRLRSLLEKRNHEVDLQWDLEIRRHNEGIVHD